MTALAMRSIHVPRAIAAGGAIVAGVAAVAGLSFLWVPYDPAAMDIVHRLEGPSPAHWLGTDQFGRDVFSMILVGARISLAVGFVAVGIGIVAGVALGLTAAAARGMLDEAVMRLSDFTFAFPAILSAILITAAYGPGAVNAIVAIGIFNVPVFARLARGAALQVMAKDFVRAARAVGMGLPRIMWRHVLPNIAGLIAVQASVQFALAILAEAGLAYLGLGTQPPQPSWGRMLYEAQSFMHRAPLNAVFPGAAIALAVLGFNLLGDGLRDVIDPRTRRFR
jgi:peptide/nickel transport system permease protein